MFVLISGYIYLIGGSLDDRFGDVGSRVVTRLNLQTGCLERTQPLPILALRPAVATSPSSIAVCGGISVASCQRFSSVTETYVDFLQMHIQSNEITHLYLLMVELGMIASA